jgi:protein-S-isoprenylcysteine O-methyltransferase Ste14
VTSEASRSTSTATAGRAWRLSLSLTDVLFLLVLVVLAYGHLQEFRAGKTVSMLFVVQQVMVIIFVLLHRPPVGARASWQDIALAWGGTLLPLAMQPNGLAPNPIGNLLVVVGVVLATGAVMSLGRSFGIEAANRGVQTHGLYRFVRHPIYAAYLPLVGGYLLAYPSWANAIVIVTWIACQVARIWREEAVLRLDAQYQAYVGRVRWRLIPGAW